MIYILIQRHSLPLSLSFSHKDTEEFPEATGHIILSQSECRSRSENMQLSSLNLDKIYKDVTQCHSFHCIILVWEIKLFSEKNATWVNL